MTRSRRLASSIPPREPPPFGGRHGGAQGEKEIIAKAEERVDLITKKYRRGQLSEQERYDAVIKTWERATEEVTEALSDNLDPYNPIYMMADSGARGSMKQIRQLAGMRGLMANTRARPLKSPFAPTSARD